MRKLAVLGNRPELVFGGNGSVVLTLNLTQEERDKRSAGWRAAKPQGRVEEIEEGQGNAEEVSRNDAEGSQDRVEAGDGAPDQEQDEDPVSTADRSLSRLTLQSSDDSDTLEENNKNMPSTDPGETETAAAEERKEVEEEDEEESPRHLTRLEPIYLTTRVTFTDKTTRTTRLPPTEHPLLSMSQGERSIMIASGPWPGSIFPSSLAAIWNRLVSEYCARKLTNPRDKLVAMAALASAFEAQYGTDVLGQYHAGIWRKFAGEGLLWFAAWRRARQTTEAPAIEYDDRAPSWSWAAVRRAQYPDPKAEIENGVDYMDLDFAVLALETTTAEDSPSRGAVAVGGYVRVSGLVMDVWWAMDFNRHGEQVVNLFTAPRGERVGKYGSAGPDHDWLYPPEDGTREHVLLLLGRRFVQGVGHNQDHECECLLLRPRQPSLAGDHVPDDEYVRVGFAGPVLFNFEEEWRPRFRQVELSIF
ncbi:uncharacterized protein B0I36DRAFT_49578 [Microdochium trichocladiopsis]|uniref:Uncharacterized protein n=1 Tax=Microdochium trichocladiopsis TaxID=1682393 RepID=A0A9P8XSD7_9PEZI|nr:uncharacterized protein B0I36DRAFT_49578 [Microdochium trichocladiopsis]KAH7014381.1 hypothetical protein B0I36DRAFT_49578 [Microdochium trichocladiopsis]